MVSYVPLLPAWRWAARRKDSPVNQVNRIAMTAIVRLGDILHGAISRNDVAKAIELMEHGAPVNERRDHGTTPLHWAASEDYVDIVEALLAHGADPNAAASDGCTPLHYAAREDAAGAVSALLRGGADADAVNAGGRRAADEIYDDTDGGEGEDIARMLRNAPSVGTPGAPPELTAASTSGTGTTTKKPAARARPAAATGLLDTSVSPLELAMADLAASLGREKLGRERGSVEAGTGGADGGADSRGPTQLSGSGGGNEAGPGRVLVSRPYVPAADHDAAAPVRSEARSVTVKLDADGKLPAEMYADIRREYLASGGPPDRRGEVDGGSGYDRIPEVARSKADERRRMDGTSVSAIASTEEN